ncbi:epidermal growth factor receptor kinase substrate 8-like protein 1a [Denticeps clupeoides]|uniref:epidermal growth factor receptor kinase substrate 8-like protein 1a n=1 Tax=Denticeps clupeoides TaxID=299321 RepID=UPI0010A36B52|nr:epidermal growth factor receptor kinase substrate 8-like protein 1 [Denticeps clupeoides]
MMESAPYAFPLNGNSAGKTSASVNHAEREVELLNHCFEDVESFMSRLQQAAEAQCILQQKSKKKSRKSSKKQKKDELLAAKACPPSEEEFVDIFQKLKLSLSLLSGLEDSIAEPNSEELIHHLFVPLKLLVKTTGSPTIAASVSSPGLSGGAVTLLQKCLTADERELWSSLGSNWNTPCGQLGCSAAPYSPIFLSGWQPQEFDFEGKPCTKQEASINNTEDTDSPATQTLPACEMDRGGGLPEDERLYCCSYDFVARNSSELSVLQGETLEVLESSKNWWKCKNSYDEIGFVPHNILEPLSALKMAEADPSRRRHSKKAPILPPSKRFSYSPTSPKETSPTSKDPRSLTMPPTVNKEDRVVLNDELRERLASGVARSLSVRPSSVVCTSNTSPPINYQSSPVEVESWLHSRGFSSQTVQSLSILSCAQLFSLKKDELLMVSPEEGSRVYSQIMVQKALLEDARKATELEEVMKRQKIKVDSIGLQNK